MRKIKFRAWDGAQMYYNAHDFYLCLDGVYFGLFEGEMDELICGQPILMQFTGLTDKNGKEIYEGDIVKPGMWNFVTSSPTVARVEYKAPLFVTISTDGYITALESHEVIGNIYENPELLK